jgi:hypothetical protein
MFVFSDNYLPLDRVCNNTTPYTYHMAIPKEILAVKRPSSTVVKQRGDRYVVIKRTSRRKGNRVVPVDLGTVGEIINGTFVEQQIKFVGVNFLSLQRVSSNSLQRVSPL